jgi:hypothetical protein
MIKQTRKRDYVYLLDDLELTMTKNQLERVTQNWNEGYRIMSIAEMERRDPIEILFALIHQAKRGRTLRPLGVSL